MAAGVAAFFFTSASITSDQQIEAFSKALKRISNFVQSQKRPFIATISQDGTVTLWVNHKGEDCIQQKLIRRGQNKIRKQLAETFGVDSFTDDE